MKLTNVQMALKLVAEHPSVVAKLRKEQEKLSSDSVERTAELLWANPTLIKQLHYMYAVVRESLRLLPVAMIAKDVPPGSNPGSELFPRH
jgi:cytochrome P450